MTPTTPVPTNNVHPVFADILDQFSGDQFRRIAQANLAKVQQNLDHAARSDRKYENVFDFFAGTPYQSR